MLNNTELPNPNSRQMDNQNDMERPVFKRRQVAFKDGFVRRSVGLSSEYSKTVLKERFYESNRYETY